MEHVRVAVVGATGYSGQELVRLLARHPARPPDRRLRIVADRHPAPPARARAASGTAASRRSATRPWRGLGRRGVPVAARGHRRGSRARRSSRRACASSTCPGPSGCATSTRGSGGIPKSPATFPEGTVTASPSGTRAALAGARLVSCPGCYPTAALLALSPLAGRRPAAAERRRHRREVGHLRRGQGADRAHALLGEPRQRRRLRGVQPPAHRRDGAGARAPGDLRAAPRAARPRHPRDDLRAPRCRRPRPRRSVPPTSGLRPTRRSCGSPATRLPEIKHVAHTNFCDIGWRARAGRTAAGRGRRASTTC